VSRRKLRPDELELWQKVARTADRLHPHPHPPRPARASNVLTPARSDTPPEPQPIASFVIGQASRGKDPAHDVLPGLPERIASAPVHMDKKAWKKLNRGKLMPEGRIDLHGMSRDQARPALTAFVTGAHASGRRLVLVITGKGKHLEDSGPIPVRPGVLRHAVPQWLALPPLAQLVLQVAPAHARHGGSGAYYVYLRRPR